MSLRRAFATTLLAAACVPPVQYERDRSIDHLTQVPIQLSPAALTRTRENLLTSAQVSGPVPDSVFGVSAPYGIGSVRISDMYPGRVFFCDGRGSLYFSNQKEQCFMVEPRYDSTKSIVNLQWVQTDSGTPRTKGIHVFELGAAQWEGSKGAQDAIMKYSEAHPQDLSPADAVALTHLFRQRIDPQTGNPRWP